MELQKEEGPPGLQSQELGPVRERGQALHHQAWQQGPEQLQALELPDFQKLWQGLAQEQVLQGSAPSSVQVS